MSSQHRDEGERSRLTPGEPSHVFVTTDLPLMAFYLMNGLELVRVSKRRGGHANAQDFQFHYKDPTGRADELDVKWANSSCKDFDNSVRTLKKMCQERRRRNGRNGHRKSR